MKRSAIHKVSALNLTVDHGVNFRDSNGYDLPNMIEEIKAAGRIIEPIHYRKEDKVVLRGNRRIAAAQALLKDPTINPELRKALESIEAFSYEGLDERSTTELVLDHGSQKPLSRVEVIKATWRLQRLMYSEKDIIVLCYQQLAKFTGNARKAWEASQLPPGDARDKVLSTWLHGTVGNFLLAVGQMGELLREQLLLTELEKDRNLTDDEKKKVKFRVDRARVTELTKAKNKDKGGPGWTVDAGGPEFNALVEKFIKEDAAPDNGNKKKKDRPDVETVQSAADAMQSGMGLAMRAAIGKLADGEKSKLDSLDAEYHRRDKVFAILSASVPNIKDETLSKLLTAILTGSPSDVESIVAPLLTAPAAAQ
jgi:hypothetical protein